MTPPKKEPPLQKSLSQQNISAKHQQPLATSKSVTSLPKTTNNQSEVMQNGVGKDLLLKINDCPTRIKFRSSV